MKISSIVTFINITFFVVSCAPAGKSILPTPLSTVTANLSSPISIPTSSPVPTETPSPTQTAPSNDVYLATTKNSFPLQEIEGLAEFTGIMDFDNVIYTKPEAFGQTYIQAWVVIEDGGQQFLVPISYVNQEIGYIPLGLNATVAKDGTFGDWNEDALREHIGKILDILQVKGKKARVRLLIGLNSGSILRYGDLFPRLYADTNWDEGTLKFMQTGNPLDLSATPTFSQRVLPAIRITVIDAN